MLCKKYNDIAEDIYKVTFSGMSTTEKEATLENFKSRIKKLDKIYSKEEKLFSKFNIFENHLSAVFICQETTYRIFQQLQLLIEKNKEDGLL